MKIIDVINTDKDVKFSCWPFILHAPLWDSFDETIREMLYSAEGWNEIKYLNEDGALNSSIKTIPNDVGGIYIFLAKPSIIPNSHSYLLYIGRAQKTEKHNLRLRCSRYVNEKKRSKIVRMIDELGKFLYVSYLPLPNNDIIKRTEEELIRKILPPFNDDIPNIEILEPISAFTEAGENE